MVGEIKDGKTVPFGVKIAIWVTCALLYATQVSPVFYCLFNGSGSNAWVYIGAIVMVCGITLESAADLQKNRAKKVNPRRFVDTGLFRLVRCPNYLGEMIFWTGVFISGIGAVRGWQWLVCLLGYGGIIFVMFSGARRLEIRQNVWRSARTRTTARTPSIRSTSGPSPSSCPSSPCTAWRSTSGWSPESGTEYPITYKKRHRPSWPVPQCVGKAQNVSFRGGR